MNLHTIDATSTLDGRNRGVARCDVLVFMSVLAAAMGAILPVLASDSCDPKLIASADNLRDLATAHVLYAADWNDRQFTVVRDDLGAFGGSCENYQAARGCHPPVVLEALCDGSPWGFSFCDDAGGSCRDFFVVRPINFDGPDVGTGSFRLPNARGFNEYLNGRFFDPTFYAPKDGVLLEQVEPFLLAPCVRTPPEPSPELGSSYVLSPAAMYHPDVMRAPVDGGWVDPDTLPSGYQSPSVNQAKHPAQKTRMIEHHWLQNPPAACNPAFEGCVPYSFNLGFRSRPLAMFYDGHVRPLSSMEAEQSDAQARHQSPRGDGLWRRGTPLGPEGYFLDLGADFSNTSYHILTTEGIRGRDTIR